MAQRAETTVAESSLTSDQSLFLNLFVFNRYTRVCSSMDLYNRLFQHKSLALMVTATTLVGLSFACHRVGRVDVDSRCCVISVFRKGEFLSLIVYVVIVAAIAVLYIKIFRTVRAAKIRVLQCVNRNLRDGSSRTVTTPSFLHTHSRSGRGLSGAAGKVNRNRSRDDVAQSSRDANTKNVGSDDRNVTSVSMSIPGSTQSLRDKVIAVSTTPNFVRSANDRAGCFKGIMKANRNFSADQNVTKSVERYVRFARLSPIEETEADDANGDEGGQNYQAAMKTAQWCNQSTDNVGHRPAKSDDSTGNGTAPWRGTEDTTWTSGPWRCAKSNDTSTRNNTTSSSDNSENAFAVNVSPSSNTEHASTRTDTRRSNTRSRNKVTTSATKDPERNADIESTFTSDSRNASAMRDTTRSDQTVDIARHAAENTRSALSRTKTMLTVATVFALLYAPIVCVRTYEIASSATARDDVGQAYAIAVTQLLVTLNSCVNFVIYGAMNGTFRLVLKQSLLRDGR